MSNSDEIISQLVTALKLLSGQNFSRHFDELGISKEAYSVDFWRWGCLTTLVSKLRAEGESRTILVVFSLECSGSISCFDSHNGENLSLSAEPPTVYLIEGEEFFDIANEDYRKKLDLFDDEGLNCLFRSWRDDQAASRGWEFNNSVYVWSPACVRSPVSVT